MPLRARDFRGSFHVWEQRKLGECFTERIESMPDGELISVTINDGIKKFSELGRHDNSNEDKSKYKKVCVGDIAYNSMRMWQGASGYSPYHTVPIQKRSQRHIHQVDLRFGGGARDQVLSN